MKSLTLQQEQAKSEEAFRIGDRVVVDRIYTGTVRYVGRVGTKKHSTLGVELDTSNGENNGSRAGRVYFECKPRHGVFREYRDVRPYKTQDYNQTGIINTTEVEEIPHNSKAVSELINENMEIQRELEVMVKENKKLKEELKEEKEKRKSLEEKIEKIESREGLREKRRTEGVDNSSVIIGIVSEIVSSIKEKIETENRIFQCK
ncbi:hypothetical protein NEMIN01_1956 [Nematocida minor]|uniref:uncharacterized protein n=1 Tax=Nematocida minor TaxID=1912983 RepID=UPI00221FDE05|nr:uncharacterized protein NEMIN01_1956 [Nematocida minor]KAI5192342.1 hypothetical protein NEMIN01_1956 [Nematocida minor]